LTLPPSSFSFSANNTDLKAQIIPTLNYNLGATSVILLALYDGPEAGQAFSTFNSAKPSIDLWKQQTFLSLVQSSPSEIQGGHRGLFHTLSLQKYSLPLLQQIANQTNFYGSQSGKSTNIISYDIEPFSSTYGQHADANGPSVYPHSNSPLPLNLYFAWDSIDDDAFFKQSALDSVALLASQAKSEGQDLDKLYLYPNYCLASTPASSMYGTDNAAALRKAKTKYDPNNIMDLTTFFSFAT